MSARLEEFERAAPRSRPGKARSGAKASDADADFEPESVDSLDALGLTPRLVQIAETGRAEGEKRDGDDSRSAWAMHFAHELARLGVPAEVIAGVLLDDRFEVGAYTGDRNDAEREAIRTAARACATVAEEIAERVEAVEQLAAEPLPDVAKGETAKEGAEPKRREFSYAESLGWREPKMLVDRLIPYRSFVQNYGARKSQKTFVTIDMALCVATGRPYHGFDVQREVVTFVAAEGSRSRFRDRVTAWLKLNEVDPAELDGWFWQYPFPVNLTDERERREFVVGLRNGRQRGLIVFDTVSKNSGGVDEDTAGMKSFCNGANEVRLATGATVLVVHHEGKDAGRKGRGSTVLPGDVDMSLRTFKSGAGRCTVTVDEARDVEEGLALSFVLRTVDLGDGERAAALEFVGRRDEEAMTTNERVLVTIAESYGALESAGDLEDPNRDGFSRANAYKVVAELRKQGLVEPHEVRVTSQGRAEAIRLGAALFDVEETEAS